MDESELQLGDAEPEVGDKVEVQLKMPSGEEKWWLCGVVRAGDGHIGVQPPGYSMEEFEQQEGFEKRKDGGTTYFRLPTSSERLNRSGTRRTDIKVGQAPFGCVLGLISIRVRREGGRLSTPISVLYVTTTVKQQPL